MKNSKLKIALLAAALGLGMNTGVSAASEAQCEAHEIQCYVYGNHFSCRYIAQYCMQ